MHRLWHRQVMAVQERQAQTAHLAQLAQTLTLTTTRNLGLRQQQAQTAQTESTGLMVRLENLFLLLPFLCLWLAGLAAQKA
jgi:hypothetical protein